ncbi:MAG: peptidylprolyl isomerase [Candidatus Latescibacterota bacterium]|nr:peptidylprolyl isomerase [Candidatus Latescibacterota bacterium]
MNRVRGTAMGCLLLLASCGGGPEGGGDASVNKAVLMDPQGEEMTKQAPDTYRVRFETSAGDIQIEVERSFSPHGADRFYNLVANGFYDECRFFRIVPNFIVQWGMSPDPEVTAVWQGATIPDDPVQISNDRGTITFAKTNSPNSRTTQLFINLVDNARLDGMGFAPFGRIVSGMDVVDALNPEYGEIGQGNIAARGNAFLIEKYPNLDYIKSATIEE